MDYEAVQGMIIEIMSSRLTIFIVFLLIIVISIAVKKIRDNKVKILLADERFRDAKLFVSEIKSPVIISPNGYIGIAMENSAVPVVAHIKNLRKMVASSDDFVIAQNDDDDPNGFLFTNIASRVASSLQKKTKKINLVLIDEDKTLFDISLFVSTLRRAIVPGPSKQNAIKQLLNALEEAEKKHKGKN